MFYKEQTHEERAKGALNAVCRTQSKFYKEQTHEQRVKRVANGFTGRSPCFTNWQSLIQTENSDDKNLATFLS